ncbi:ThiF family adenylyltransferase [Paenarthrobacter sp. PH39-S1]|uniref:ThiF family adenylyltransferase n=1 Tax=Paenarthrobacter sp. PH39-S1 TaxID=3046204 RepID=UPI0024B8D98B|nr:ThiF family adenylyltransferase [Paenarthrobacter sp. PH39-S1]MDJ0355555.1 ThiF family adenylyltransferase [Paenarthrobacter sp. PH39-S1]
MKINPGLRVVSRDSHMLQVGLGPGGVILEGLTPADSAFIRLLREGTGSTTVADTAARARLATPRAQQIIGSLSTVLFDDTVPLAPPGFRGERLAGDAALAAAVYGSAALRPLAGRGNAVLRIIGLGRTGAALAQGLVGAGVGTILLEDAAPVAPADIGPGAYRLTDIGMNRAAALRRQLLSLDPGCQSHVVRSMQNGGSDFQTLDLVIYAGHDAVDPAASAQLMSRDQPHLIVLQREQDATVGPLVIPGETACGECVERHRAVADPQWPQICGQLTDPATRSQATAVEESSMALCAAGSAARQALLYLDCINRPASWSAVLTLRASDGAWLQRSYPPHPECGCQFQRQLQTNGRPAPGSDRVGISARATGSEDSASMLASPTRWRDHQLEASVVRISRIDAP